LPLYFCLHPNGRYRISPWCLERAQLSMTINGCSVIRTRVSQSETLDTAGCSHGQRILRILCDPFTTELPISSIPSVITGRSATGHFMGWSEHRRNANTACSRGSNNHDHAFSSILLGRFRRIAQVLVMFTSKGTA
jgi:hypothetical protein